MSRPKKIHNGVTTSIFIEKDLKEIAKLCKVSDSDLWVRGLKATLETSNNKQSLERLLQIYMFERAEIDKHINRIKDKLIDDKLPQRLLIKEFDGGEQYEIDEKDYDPSTMKVIKRL